MTRQTWVLVHRYAGLYMAFFLVVAGLTGSLLAFYHELDAWLNPPERTASLFGEYRLPNVPGLALSGGVYYIGQRPVNNANQAFVDGYTTLSLGARHTLRIKGKRTTLQAVLDNVTDENYWNSAGNNLLGVGMPRTFKVVAKVEL